MKQTAAQLAQQGRYGDTQLLHISPDELRGIAAFGELTYNPVTGLPEAFSLGKAFKKILPIAAAIFAPYALPTIAPALASGIGSGLATAALTGDIKRGLVAGVIGAGLGSAMGAARDAGTVAAQSAAETARAGVIPSAGIGVAGIGSEVAGHAPITQAILSPGGNQALGGVAGLGASGVAPAAGGIGSLGSYLKAPFTQSEVFMKQMMKPGTIFPMALGAGQLSQWDMEDRAKKLREQQEEESEERRRTEYERLQGAYEAAVPFTQRGLSPYRGIMSYNTPPPLYSGYAEGGKVEPVDYASIYPWLTNIFGWAPTGVTGGRGGIDPVTVQKNLRGTHSVAPQRQYMPGFNPEFRYFQDDPNSIQQAPPTYANTWTSMYRASPIQMAIQGAPVPWHTRIPQQPYFESILDRKLPPPEIEELDEKKKKKEGYAAGGDVTLTGSQGQAQIAGGGIANVPTEFTQQQQQPDPRDLEMVAMAILGRMDNPEQVIEGFIGKYGPDVFRMVREMVLKAVNPQAQTEGKIEGPGGGMADQVPGTVGDQQGVAVSPGEYIVPADVVSGLGDGSTDAGAQQLDQMAQNVRMARGGSVQQPQPINPRRILPA